MKCVISQSIFFLIYPSVLWEEHSHPEVQNLANIRPELCTANGQSCFLLYCILCCGFLVLVLGWRVFLLFQVLVLGGWGWFFPVTIVLEQFGLNKNKQASHYFSLSNNVFFRWLNICVFFFFFFSIWHSFLSLNYETKNSN